MTALVFTVLNAWLLTVRIRTREPRTGDALRRPGRAVSGDVDVLVVGGGPVGLAAARARRRARAVRRRRRAARRDPVDKACGEGLMPAAVAALPTLGVDPPGVATCAASGTSAPTAALGEARLPWRGQGRGVRRTALARRAAPARRRAGRQASARTRSYGCGRAPGGRRGAVAGHGEVAGSLAARRRRPALDRPRAGCRRLRRPRAGAAAVRAAPALRGRAVDRPRRGALGRGRGGVRDPGRPARGGRRRSSPTSAGPGHAGVAGGVPRACRAAARGGADHARARRGAAGADRRQRARPAGCCSSATRPATSTR